MSRTKRNHWNWKEEVNDGFFNKSYPKYFYHTKKVKAPPLLEEEVDIYSDLYVFDDMGDLDEGYFCNTCGQWLPSFIYYEGTCEC